jgi:pimeloyl-ACP methyl ester carboxylesterase
VAGNEPVILVGWSTGGFSALNLAAEDPDRVLGVMSISGFARGCWGGSLGLIQRLTRIPLIGGTGADLVSRIMNSSERLVEWFLLRGAAQRTLARRSPEWPAVLASLRNSGRNLDATAMANLFARLYDIDISESLPRIKCPVLIVAGLREPYVAGIETRRLLSLISHAESRLVPDAGHLFFAEYREIWQELLPDWLQRLERK